MPAFHLEEELILIDYVMLTRNLHYYRFVIFVVLVSSLFLMLITQSFDPQTNKLSGKNTIHSVLLLSIRFFEMLNLSNHTLV